MQKKNTHIKGVIVYKPDRPAKVLLAIIRHIKPPRKTDFYIFVSCIRSATTKTFTSRFGC